MSDIPLLVPYLTRITNDNTIENKVWDRIYPTFENLQEPTGELRSRETIRYALVLCEQAKQNGNNDKLQRLDLLINLAKKMQFPNGHFKWYWKDKVIRDLNAVEFCMIDATLLSTRHQNKIQRFAPNAWLKLQKAMRLGLTACKKHHVPPKYTNIALLNALNLIFLGEYLNDTDAIQKGYRRLENFYIYTWEWGIHENLSGVYLRLQLECLELILMHCQHLKAQLLAQRLFTYFCFNAACLSFEDLSTEPSSPLQTSATKGVATTPIVPRAKQPLRNRLSDLKIARGYIRSALNPNFVDDPTIEETPSPDNLDSLEFSQDSIETYEANEEFRSNSTAMLIMPFNQYDFQLSKYEEHFNFLSVPRHIEAAWGPNKNASLVHHLTEDIALTCLQRGYDFPKSHDLPFNINMLGLNQDLSDHNSNIRPRINSGHFYLIPGLRGNAYQIRPQRHNTQVWAAAQDNLEAMCLTLYPTQNYKRLETSFVLPLHENIEFYQGNANTTNWEGPTIKLTELSNHKEGSPQIPTQPITITQGPQGDTVILRHQGTDTAIGIRILWTQNILGNQAPTQLQYDNVKEEYRLSEEQRAKNPGFVVGQRPISALRLTALHHLEQNPIDSDAIQNQAGAIFWVKVRATNDSQPFNEWCQAFARAEFRIPTLISSTLKTPKGIKKQIQHLRVESQSQNLIIETQARNHGRYDTTISPEPTHDLLEVTDPQTNNIRDIGREILEENDLIQNYKKSLQELADKSTITVPGKWEAEDGLLRPPMALREHPKSSGGHFIWLPNTPRKKTGSQVGSATWCLDIPQQEPYYIWGHILSPNKNQNSFFIKIFQNEELESKIWKGEIILRNIWRTGINQQWAWVPLDLRNNDTPHSPTPIVLEEGTTFIQLFPREAGTKIDQLYISNNIDNKPWA